VVIGGTNLFGGRGSLSALIGALISACSMDWRFGSRRALAGFTVGVLIIVAVTLDQWIRKVAA
jgi:fructose transport system permease protein